MAWGYPFKTSSCIDLKCELIEQAIQNSIESSRQSAKTIKRLQSTDKLTSLIHQRRDIKNTNTSARSQISKEIRKELRAIKRAVRRSEIEKILTEYRQLKRISGIKSSKSKELIVGMLDSSGEDQFERQSIADVFATLF